MKRHTFHPLERKTYWKMDNYGMVVHDPYPWDKSAIGRGDSLGRTALCNIVYHPFFPMDGPDKCVSIQGGTTIFERHPEGGAPISRDHITLAFVSMLWDLGLYSRKRVYELIDHLPWRLSDRFTQTPDMWLWLKSVRHPEKKIWSFAWQLMSLIIFLFIVPWNTIIRTITRPLPEAWQHVTNKALYPHYAYWIFCWQLFVTPYTWLTPILKWVARQEAEKDNYVIRALLGRPVPEGVVEEYHSLAGFRWSSDSRIVSKVPKRKAIHQEVATNDLDGDFLVWAKRYLR